MEPEYLEILLSVAAALGLHLGVRWYIRHGLATPERKGDDWLA
ncbi:hypothetical protein [Pseudomonas jinjuensis]|uniref:Uncharacterized protein n=1 Tax=Pseudomonas jinjuensis TaxID=198616 RepID=A0A1H0N7B8_9PSED|nr:hypothetical protein [Pseudomonas jinjuensis]SDO88567.1 hypothetical protein SAMN05216193_117114 [Pseudomonas jinjuensis]